MVLLSPFSVAVLQPLVAVEEQSFVLQGLLVTLALSSDAADLVASLEGERVI